MNVIKTSDRDRNGILFYLIGFKFEMTSECKEIKRRIKKFV